MCVIAYTLFGRENGRPAPGNTAAMSAALSLVHTTPLGFSTAEEAWHWWATAEIARGLGDEIDGPMHPDQVFAAAEASGLNRFEWYVLVGAGIHGDEPNQPIEKLVYASALAKLDTVLRARCLIG